MRSVKSRGGLGRWRGTDENTITRWIHSVHRLAGIHFAMSSLTGQINETSEQHVEQRESRIKRDLMYLATLQDWFEDHSPFTNFTELISVANGIAALKESQVNCDEAKEIGAEIQQSLDDVEFKMSKIKRSEKVKAMAAMGIGGGIRQCRRKCRPMLVLRRQKNVVVKVFTSAVFLFRFYSVVDNS